MNRLNSMFLSIAVGMLATTAFGATYQTDLLGLSENPANASPATGDATITINGNILDVVVNWSGLLGGPASAAHIHCCVAPPTNVGVAIGFPGFPAATSGTYMNSFDLTNAAIYTGGYLGAHGGTAAGAQAALIAALNNGGQAGQMQAYVNIHNAIFPGGEIRGFAVPIPEPTSIVLLGIGAATMLMRRRP